MIVVGGGNAGLCAVLTASQLVDTVLVLEAAPIEMRGGNTRHTRNIRHIHAGGDGVLTGADTEEELWDDLVKVSDEDIARMVILQASIAVPANDE